MLVWMTLPIARWLAARARATATRSPGCSSATTTESPSRCPRARRRRGGGGLGTGCVCRPAREARVVSRREPVQHLALPRGGQCRARRAAPQGGASARRARLCRTGCSDACPGRRPGCESSWLRRALDGLSEELRTTVALVHEEGLHHSEVGAVLGVAESTGSWRMHEVRRRLRALAGRDEEAGAVSDELARLDAALRAISLRAPDAARERAIAQAMAASTLPPRTGDELRHKERVPNRGMSWIRRLACRSLALACLWRRRRGGWSRDRLYEVLLTPPYTPCTAAVEAAPI